jgi:isopenicillin-N N-acyltransferase-like protein
VHSNHFLDPEGLGIVEPPSERRPYSRKRRTRLTALLNSELPVRIEAIQGYLRDHREHPHSLCRHEDPRVGPEEHYITVTSVIMDLNSHELWITNGPPCAGEYVRQGM